MSRLVKIINNKYVKIEEYRNPNICFNTNEYNDFEDYCTLRETFDPFEIFYENQELKKQVEENKDNYNCLLKQKEQFEYIMSKQVDYQGQQKEFIKYLEYKIDICDSFLDTIKSDLQEISYRVMSANKTYITTQIKENEIAHKVYEEILQKYKSIIGGNDV